MPLFEKFIPPPTALEHFPSRTKVAPASKTINEKVPSNRWRDHMSVPGYAWDQMQHCDVLVGTCAVHSFFD